jgi:hypothetical protein
MRTMLFSSSGQLPSNRASIAEPGACDEWLTRAQTVELPDYERPMAGARSWSAIVLTHHVDDVT